VDLYLYHVIFPVLLPNYKSLYKPENLFLPFVITCSAIGTESLIAIKVSSPLTIC